MKARWNYISLPFEVANYDWHVLFPTASAAPFKFINGVYEFLVDNNLEIDYAYR